MHETRTNARGIRRQNRSALLSRLFFEGPLSRMDLGGLTGLSSGTVSTVTAELLGSHLIVEAGQIESDGGRPRTLLQVDPAYAHVVGADVGETGVRVEVFDLAMIRLVTLEEPLPGSRPDPADVADLISTLTRQALETTGLDETQVLGLGVGLPGTVEPGPAQTVHAPTIGWSNVTLAASLRERGLALPIFLDNGAKTQGQAEMWFGVGRGTRHAIIALVGTGIGVALVTDGTIYRGSHSAAGEWGHITIELDGRLCRCGSRGCLEAYVGADAILQRYRERGGHVDPAASQAQALQDLLADDCAIAGEVLDETARLLGMGLTSLVNLLNPELLAFGGWAGLALAPRLMPTIRTIVATHAMPYAQRTLNLELCHLGPDAVAFGAATLPIAALLANGDPRLPARHNRVMRPAGRA